MRGSGGPRWNRSSQLFRVSSDQVASDDISAEVTAYADVEVPLQPLSRSWDLPTDIDR